MLLHKYSIKESVHYRFVRAMSSLSLRQKSSVATQQWLLTVWWRSWQKNGNLGKCVCEWIGHVRRKKTMYWRKVCSTACAGLMSVSLLVCWPLRICFSICAVHLPTVRPHKDCRPNWLSLRCRNDSLCGTMRSHAVIDTSQASFIDDSLTFK